MLSGICAVGIGIGIFGIVDGIRRYRKEVRGLDQLINQLDNMRPGGDLYPCPEFDSNGLIINWGVGVID